jgi:hypothetical protein
MMEMVEKNIAIGIQNDDDDATPLIFPTNFMYQNNINLN